MANGGIYVPVTVGLEEGVRAAIADINPMMARLQGIVNQKPITLRVDVNGVKQSISKVLKDPTIDAEALKKVLVSLENRINTISRSSRANTAKGQAELQKLTTGYGALYAKLQMMEGRSPLAKMAGDTLRTSMALDKATKSSDRFNASLGIQNGYIGKLLSRTLIYTGLFRAVSMVKSIRDVTAEFELQRVALGAIIQDTERASDLFNQIKMQALRSPFEIKDLVTYTKQLAAYRIETDDLFETTKRLADISAGLGVDMDRLILAYGQVRAAAVLRGQELRQFTEAGIPLVAELAKKFTQLRNETVSAAEVFQLISERAVPFSMVKEIFEDMTNAGGIFYEMQAKQAETLKGQWSNLKDAVSMMYDEIGNTEVVRGGIEKLYKVLRNMTTNWRDVAGVVGNTVKALVTYKVVMSSLAVRTAALTKAEATSLVVREGVTVTTGRLTTAIIGETAAKKLNAWQTRLATVAQIRYRSATLLTTKALWRLVAVLAANPWGALAAGIGLALTALLKHNKAAVSAEDRISNLNEAVAKFNDTSKNVQQTRTLISDYKELTSKAELTANETKRLRDVTESLAKTYPEAIKGVNEFTGALVINTDKIAQMTGQEAKATERYLKEQKSQAEIALASVRAEISRVSEILASGEKTVGAYGATWKEALSEDDILEFGAYLQKLQGQASEYTKAIDSADTALSYLVDGGKNVPKQLTEWQHKLAAFETTVNGISFKAFLQDEIENFSSVSDAIDETVKKYNEYKAKADAAHKAAAGKSGEEGKQLSAQATKAKAMADLYYSILQYYHATDKLKGSGEQRSSIQALKEEVDLLKKVYEAYEKRRQVSINAKDDIQSLFGESIKQLRFGPAFSASDLSDILRKYRAALASMPKTDKDVISLAFDIDSAIADEEQKAIERKLKELAEKVSRSETAKNFFNNILSTTGNRDLAGELTLSVFGETGDLEENMMNQILAAFDQLPAELSPKLSEAVDEATKAVDFNKLEALISSLPQKAQEAARRIVDNGKKTNAEWLKDLYGTYAKSQTYAARIQAERDKADEQKRKVAMSTDLNPTQKATQTQAIEDYRDKAIAKILTEELKNSDEWIKVFENVDRVGTLSIKNLMGIIKDFIDTNKEDLTPEALRTLMSEYNKLYEEAINRDPFAAIVDSINGYVSARKRLERIKSLKQDPDALALMVSDAEAKVAEAKNALDTAKTDDEKASAATRLAAAEAELAEAQALVTDSSRAERDAQDDLRAAMDKLTKGLDGVGKLFSKFQDVLKNVGDLFIALGGDDTSDFMGVLDGLSEGLEAIVKITAALAAGILAVAAAAAVAESHPLILAATAIAAGIIGIAKAISNIKVNRANREIKRQKELLDDLERSYERLEVAQAKAFGTDYIDNYSARLAALVAEQEAYEKQAAAERSKGKKADEEKIHEYEDAAEDAANKIKDMSSELSEFFTDMDVTSAAKEFAQAWLEAYMEFGNTADAIKEKFGDMIQNMVINSLMAKVVQTVLQPIFDSIDQMASDGELSSEEIASIADRIPQAIADIDNGLSNVVKYLQASGVNLRQTGGNLTGISRDIASASEESILGLAAGINTQNFYISQIHANVAQILLLMQGNGAQIAQTAVAGTSLMVENPFLTQYLPSIDQHTANIEAYCAETLAALNKVIKPRGTQGAFVVNSSIS